MTKPTLPRKGTSTEKVLKQLQAHRGEDVDWKRGRTFSLVYYAGDEVMQLLHDAYSMFMAENGLSPIAFPSLRDMENEVVAMTANMLHGGDSAAGSMTSGGTESIFMAMKTARQWARKHRPEIIKPKIVAPVTAHPAFIKSAHYLDIQIEFTPLRDDWRADPEAMRAAVDDDTVILVGSAICYPYGVVDPIEEIAAIADERGILMHVDGCLGGFMLPFVSKLGYEVPIWDFRAKGVTSISADVHKYGYAAKGASTVTYRDAELRKLQFYAYPDWPGGIYVTPTMAGARPGGAVAAAWAVMHHLGEEGYMKLAKVAMDATNRIRAGIESIDGLRVMGNPNMTVLAFDSDEVDVFTVGSKMDARGWHLDRNQFPSALHIMVTPAHAEVADRLIEDLRLAVEEARKEPAGTAEGMAALYGAAAAMPDRGAVSDFAIGFMDSLYTIS
ncbi:MAG: aspartate aminotransferase family protein [Myxococcales bacterium]|nr:aspartate aminotransferase family protein [Myxococcales bacterium]